MDTRRVWKKIDMTSAMSASLVVISAILLNKYLKNGLNLQALRSLMQLIELLQQRAYLAAQDASKKQDRSYPTWQKLLDNKALLSQVKLPATFVDLDAFDRNMKKFVDLVRPTGKTIRFPTKSARVPMLILRALEKYPDIFQGVMCFSAREAKFLRNNFGIDDILIAYPTLQSRDCEILRHMHENGANIKLVVDSVAHMELLEKTMQGVSAPFPIVIEMDMSLRPLGGLIHLGVRRSPVRSLDQLRDIVEASRRFPSLELIGLQAYEGAVAGLPDNNPFKKMLNPIAHQVRNFAARYAAYMRAQVPQIFEDAKIPLKIFNGGGTGSATFAVQEQVLTELSIGSGFLDSHLFNYYSNLQGPLALDPAIVFISPVTRSSDPDYVTCLGGNYTASGEPSMDRAPLILLPKGLKYTSSEGLGEVQAPLIFSGEKPLDFVMFCPAKAGEHAETRNQYVCIASKKDGIEIVDYAKTYRGLGKNFL